MTDEREKLPLDTRLISETVIELNISRHNVDIYPEDHPLVERSLKKAFDLLQQVFELRPDITLAVAKDTLIIDDSFLDKKSPVYREFALHLHEMSIAYVTFISGLTKDELYTFHQLLSKNVRGSSSVKTPQEVLKESNLIHIKIGFIDYGAFSFEEGKTKTGDSEEHLWERYLCGLLDGTLQTEVQSNAIQEIPPDALARLLNGIADDNLKEETYDRVITTYLKKSSEGIFLSRELKKTMDFINGLRPELKRQFLSATVRTVSKNIESVKKALGEISADEVIRLLRTINEQKVVIPDTLRSLLDKFTKVSPVDTEELTFEGRPIVDDIFLSPDVMNLLQGESYETFITDTYLKKEVQRLLKFDFSEAIAEKLKDIEKDIGKECSDENIERYFNQMIQVLISSDVISKEEYEYFINTLKEQTEQFAGTGQYEQVLKTIRTLESNAARNYFPDITSEAIRYYNSPEFISQFIDSIGIIGKEMRKEVLSLCEYYGKRILPPLMDALIDEESLTLRRFLLSLITHFGTEATSEAIKRLSDNRWYVKRNMLFILTECGNEDALPHVRPYCHHENPKASFQAIKCLLKAGDSYGVKVLRDYLRADSREIVEQAIAISGIFRVRDVVPDLTKMLRKRALRGAAFHDKIPIVNALGQIGDPRALVALRNILSARSFLFKGAIERLKKEIYRTLKNYPYEDVRDLIEERANSKYMDS